jgi:hypothetical protein
MRPRTLVLAALLLAAPLVALAPTADAWGMCTRATREDCPGTLCVTRGIDLHDPSDCEVAYVP